LDTTNASDEVKAFITGTFIKEQIKFGDTFHLIGFNNAAAVEMSRRIMGNDDLNAAFIAVRSLRKTSVASNPAKALDFAATYIKSLTSGRLKKVVLITNAANARNSVSEAAPQFSTIHASLEWMNLPSAAAPPIVAAPDATKPAAPSARPPAAEQKRPATAERKPTIITPESPASSIVRIYPKAVFQTPRLSPAIAPFVSAIFFCMTFAFTLLCRYTLQSLDRAFFFICSEKTVEPAFLSLFVEDQNTNIGRRNMHTVSAGWSLTLGGGDSDFLIFLVPMPQNIAKIRFDGDECVFIPQKKQFFPELNDRMLPDCAGKTIKIRSNRNYDLFIRIMRHEAPYKKLRALFQSIKLPAQFSRI
jgi:hypothetical protein